jgi:hypothetical protein
MVTFGKDMEAHNTSPVIEEKKSTNTFNRKNNRGSVIDLSSISLRKEGLTEKSVMIVYGGSKAYSGGFCCGNMYELFMVPLVQSVASSSSRDVPRDVFDSKADIYVVNHTDRPFTPSYPKNIFLEDGTETSSTILTRRDRLLKSSAKSIGVTRPRSVPSDLGIIGAYNQIKYALTTPKSVMSRPNNSTSNPLNSINLSSNTKSSVRPMSAPISYDNSQHQVDHQNATHNDDCTQGNTSSVVPANKSVIKEHVRALEPIAKNHHLTKVQARKEYSKLYPPPMYPSSWKTPTTTSVRLTKFS